jgi:amino acid permease
MADHEKKSSSIVGTNQGAPFVDGSSMSGSHHNDVEKGTTEQLQRRLQSRHLQMIAIGGTIGTGLVSRALKPSILEGSIQSDC